jgi:nucleotide-binding universal stress UspA family protein
MATRALIIGYTHSDAGDDAVALGRLMAELIGATPIIAAALPWSSNLMSRADLEIALHRHTRDDFARIAEELAGMDPRFEAIASRSPAAALQELARTVGAEMLVIGSGHRGPVSRTFAGSTGHSLLHGAPCPVVVAPRGYAKSSPRIGRVGVAFDGSAPSWSALETGIGLAERLHGELEVLVARESPTYGYATALGVLSGEGLHTAEESRAKRLVELAQGPIPPDLSHSTRELHGDAGHVLSEASEDVDLLVCGSRGYGPILQTALGSTTRYLIDHARCPVVVLPRGKGLDPLKLSASAWRSAGHVAR